MKNWFELIEKYINNELSASERKEIESLLATNKDFAKEYQLHKDVNMAIAEDDIMHLRKTLREIHRNIRKDTGTTIRKLYERKWHLAAASLTILILIGSIFFSTINKPSSDLFNQYYQAETSIMSLRSNDIDVDTDVYTALKFYTNAEYQKAIDIFLNRQDNVIAQFYLGLSYIETQNYAKAKESFQNVLDHNDNLFIEQAEWYKALCLLKLNNQDEAVKLFNKIENSNSLFKDQASEIIKTMK